MAEPTTVEGLAMPDVLCVIQGYVRACDPFLASRTIAECAVRCDTYEVSVLGTRDALVATGYLPSGVRFAGDNPVGQEKGRSRGSSFRDADGRCCRVSRADWLGYPYRLTIKRTKIEEAAARLVSDRAEQEQRRIAELTDLINQAPSSASDAKWHIQESVRITTEFMLKATVSDHFYCSLDAESRDAIKEIVADLREVMRDATFSFDEGRRDALVRERNYLVARKADPDYRRFIGGVLATTKNVIDAS